MGIEITPGFPPGNEGTPGNETGGSAGSLGGSALAGELYAIPIEVDIDNGSVETPIFILRNPSGNTKRLFVGKFMFSTIHHSDSIIARLHRAPTITTLGTQRTPESLHIGGGVPASSMEVHESPTVTDDGTELAIIATGKDQRTVPLDYRFGLVLEPGQDLLITGVSSTNSKNLAVTVSWAEVAI